MGVQFIPGPAPAPTSLPPVARSAPPDSRSSGSNRPDGAGEWCDIAIDVGALADILAKNAGWRWRRTIFAPPARGVIAAPPRTFAHTVPARSSLAAFVFFSVRREGAEQTGDITAGALYFQSLCLV